MFRWLLKFQIRTYELITGPLFEATFPVHQLIPQFKKVIGNMPEDWISNALRDNVLNELPKRLVLCLFPIASKVKNHRRYQCKFFLPLEDNLTQYYGSSSTVGKCLRKMLVLDPRAKNRVQVHELRGDLWFTRSVKKDASDSLVCGTDLRNMMVPPPGWLNAVPLCILVGIKSRKV